MVWIGKGASINERKTALNHAAEYLKNFKRPPETPISRQSRYNLVTLRHSPSGSPLALFPLLSFSPSLWLGAAVTETFSLLLFLSFPEGVMEGGENEVCFR